MPDKTRPLVPIMLDKKRHLKLDLNAMAAFQDVTGINLFQGFDAEKMGPKELRALLWSCLIHEDKELTLEAVGSWITTDNIAELADIIGEAFTAAMPEKEDDSSSGGGEAKNPLPG